MGTLTDRLKAYAQSDMYPLHMPGHKRNLTWNINPYDYDITEIDGFDDSQRLDGACKQTL